MPYNGCVLAAYIGPLLFLIPHVRKERACGRDLPRGKERREVQLLPPSCQRFRVRPDSREVQPLLAGRGGPASPTLLGRGEEGREESTETQKTLCINEKH